MLSGHSSDLAWYHYHTTGLTPPYTVNCLMGCVIDSESVLLFLGAGRAVACAVLQSMFTQSHLPTSTCPDWNTNGEVYTGDTSCSGSTNAAYDYATFWVSWWE
jgi:hypothetical protein